MPIKKLSKHTVLKEGTILDPFNKETYNQIIIFFKTYFNKTIDTEYSEIIFKLSLLEIRALSEYIQGLH